MKRSLIIALALASSFTMACRSLRADFGSGLIVKSEATFFSFHRSPGTQVGDDPGDAVNFDWEASPRLTVGFSGLHGIGGRIRYWEYDQSQRTVDGAGSIGVDTTTLDFEIFRNIRLSDLTIVQLFGGLRYNEFEEILVDGGSFASNSIDGLGTIVGAAFRRELWLGAFTSRSRFSLLVDDKYIVDDTDGPTVANESILSIVEIGCAYELQREFGCALLTTSIGFEWQKWSNYTEGHDVANNGLLDFRGGGGDVGFVGFVVGAGLNY